MDIMSVMQSRHSVRKYLDKPIEQDKVALLQAEIDRINAESGLYFALCLNNDDVFRANEPHYGNFECCRNFFALYGGKGDDEKTGYYGQRLVLFAQSIGLNTCWVALTFAKKAMPLTAPENMKLFDVIALGYGQTQGVPHKSKPLDKLAAIDETSPEWFINGVRAAMLAPTAINQQRFYFTLKGKNGVKAKALVGPCYKTDIGIVKYHFEMGAGRQNFEWVD